MAFKLGSAAKVKPVDPVQGVIRDTRWNKDTDAPEHLLAYKGADGEFHTRWFAVEDLAEVTEQPETVVSELLALEESVSSVEAAVRTETEARNRAEVEAQGGQQQGDGA